MGERENEAPTVEEAVDDLLWVKWPSAKGGRFQRRELNRDGIERVASLLTTLQAERDAALRLVKMSVKAQAVEREHVARIAAEAERDALRTRVEKLAKRYDTEADRLEQASIDTLSVADKLRLDASASQCRELAADIREGQP